MIVPGRAICTTGGHGWDHGNHIADGTDGIRKAVREEIREGAEWIKLMVTGGALSLSEGMDDIQMTFEEIQAAVEEAGNRGKPTFAHLTNNEAVLQSVEAGIESVEHGVLMERDGAALIKEKNKFYVPTLVVYRALADKKTNLDIPTHMHLRALDAVEKHTKAFHYALEAKVKIAAGTDGGQTWLPLGESLWDELEIMSHEGMPNFEVLKSATIVGAELLRLDDEIGSLEIGKNADIILICGNPLEDIKAIRNIELVIKDGKILHQSIEK